MKRKIILGLTIYTLVLMAVGAWLATTIRTSTDDVSRVIRLHRVELLREDFLIRLRQAQADLRTGDPARARAAAAVVERLTGQGDGVDGCFGCHHSAASRALLEQLQARAEGYRLALAGLAADGAGRAEMAGAEAAGEALDAQVLQVVDVTSARLEAHTLDALSEIARTKYVVYGLVVAAPLLSILLAFVVLRGLASPLEALLQATRRLRAGDLDHRVEGLRDEFAELSLSFNEMAHSLQEQMRVLERTSQLVMVGELAAGLVHEIKNPLAGIKAATQVLAQEAGLSAEDRDVLRKVAREVDGLETLLKGFLAFARPLKPQPVELDLDAFLERATAFYRRSHGLRPGGTLRVVRAAGPLPTAQADPMQLQQILLNLLLNAADATPGGGAVEVRTAFDADAGRVVLEVADQGRGISPQHADQIFRPFFTTKAGGTGLGLAVSKRLAEQQGGTITFAGQPGGGTVFRVHLPVAPGAARA